MILCLDDTISFITWYIVPLGILLLIYWKSCKKGNEQCKIPSTSSIPIYWICLSTLFQGRGWNEFQDSFLQILTGLCHLYRKEEMVQIVWAGRPFIVCFGLAASEKILCSASATEKEQLYRAGEPWLGTGLFLSNGNKWKKRRRMLNPAFHYQILQDFVLVFNHHSEILIAKLIKMDGEDVEITRYLQLCTLDIIIEAGMGLRLNAQGEECNEYVEAVKRISSDMAQQITNPLSWITPLYILSYVERKHVQISQDFTNKIIQMRKAKIIKEGKTSDIIDDFRDDRYNLGTKKRRILLDLLLYYHLTDNTFTEEDIREEVNTFTFGGYSTTSIAISWILYLLGWHEKIQDQVYQELTNIFGEEPDRKITTNDMAEMKYTERVIKESQRLYPVVPFLARRTNEDIKADGYVIPVNSSVAISIYSIHHDPKIYPNPEVFDPDRFLMENCNKRHPFAYIPFSAGVRNCIGQRFAMMEMKIILAYILRNFKVRSLDHQDKVIFAADVVLRPKTPLRIVLKKREIIRR